MKKLQLIIAFVILSIYSNGQITADFSATSTSVCEGTPVSFLDQSISNGAITSWFWDLGNGQNSTQQNPLINYIVSGSYTVCLTVTDDLGQNDMECKTNFISVASSPTANSTSGETCSANGIGVFDLTFFDNTINGGTSNIVTWFQDSNATIPISTPSSYSTSSTTLYVLVSDGICSSALVAIPLTVYTFSSPTVAPPPLLSCTNSTITLDVGFTSTDPNTTYLWTTSGGIILFGSEDDLNAVVGGIGTYNLTVTSAACGTANATVDVEAESGFPNVVIQNPSQLSCSNPTVTLDGTGSSPSSGFTYIWKKGNFVISNNISTTVSTAGVYSLEVTNASMTWCSVTKEVTVINDGTGPNVNLPITALNDTIYNCQEVVHYSTDLLDASCANCTVEIRDANDTLICNSLPCVFDFANFVNMGYFPLYPFSISVSENNCTSSFILPTPNPSSNSILNNITDESCNGNADGSIDLTASGTGEPFTFDWEDLSGTNDPLDRTGLTAGIYTLHVTDVVGCEISAPDGFEYEVESYPIADVSATQMTYIIDCTTPSISPYYLDGSNSSSGQDLIYEWHDSDNNLISNDLIFGVDDLGTYTFTVTDTVSLCTNTDTATIVITQNITPPIADAGPAQTLTCNNTSVTLDGSNSSSGVNYYYEWVGPNFYANNILNPEVSQPGFYTLFVTDVTNGCTATDEVTVTEDIAVPAINISATTTVCPGELVMIDMLPPCVNCTVEILDAMGNPVCTTGLPCEIDPANGPFQITVTDSNTGCQNSDIFTISVPSPIEIISSVVIDVSCFGDSDGSIDIEVGGGSSPYNYLWSNASITEDQVDLSPGIYFVSVVDINGCELVENFEINEPDEIMITDVNITNVSCTATNDGSIEVTVAGGTGSYTYIWSDGSISNIISDLPIGFYNVTTTDSNGCTVVSPDYEIIQNSCFTFSNDTTICLGGTVSLSNESPTSGWNYAWTPVGNLNNPTIPNPIASPSETTTYFLTITDGGGMVIFSGEGSTVTVQNYLDFGLLDFSNAPLCERDTLELYGNLGVMFSWTGPNSFMSTEMNPELYNVTELQSGIYSLTITDGFGCTASSDVDVFIDDDCVWPGDTDTNMVVNHFDLLNIGLAYDSVGTIREDASFDWFGQPSFDWSQTTPTSNVNYKHIDADGNGIIEATDTVAITQNFGFTHNFADPIDNQFTDLPPTDGLTIITPFYVEPDTLIEGETIALSLILGDVSNVVVGLYGIGFSIEYDSSVVVPGSASINFDNCWLGDVNADAISIQFDFPNPGRIDAAITRIDGMEMDGYGLFGELIITLEDDILLWNGNSNNFTGTTTTDVTADFTITNYHLINFSQEEIIVQGTTTTAPIEETTSLSFLELNELISVFPNPTNDLFFIASQKINIERVRIFSATGELKTVKTKTGNHLEFSSKELASGIYFIEIQTREGIVTKKLVIK